jgi:NAD(P)-dependent dehydrogenase (short-subunit alcohol dehydrogenase family)
MRLKRKTAFITGGNSGIGLATARLFIAEGARVAITGRDQAKLDRVAADLGPSAVAIQADATDRTAMARAVVTATSQFGSLDILFANAGVAVQTPLDGDTVEQFEQVLKINLTGVFITVSAAVPYLNDGASIILTGSIIATAGLPGYGAYAASKAGVRAMARTWASELAARSIRVNIVSPGPIRTPIWDPSTPTPEASEAFERGLSLSIPMARLGEADEVAKTVLFLASDDSTYVQAADIAVDGGMNGAPAGAAIYRQAAG